jgi:hypothetical protein
MFENPSLDFAGRGGRTQIDTTGNISLKESTTKQIKRHHIQTYLNYDTKISRFEVLWRSDLWKRAIEIREKETNRCRVET